VPTSNRTVLPKLSVAYCRDRSAAEIRGRFSSIGTRSSRRLRQPKSSHSTSTSKSLRMPRTRSGFAVRRCRAPGERFVYLRMGTYAGQTGIDSGWRARSDSGITESTWTQSGETQRRARSSVLGMAQRCSRLRDCAAVGKDGRLHEAVACRAFTARRAKRAF
jgi:hypothetical protein